MPRVNSDVRWTWIFATVGILVVVVVIGFLTGIVGALNSIDKGLAEADSAVLDTKGNVKPLPDHIQAINANLTKIDDAVEPLSGQAGDILSALTAIDGTLVSVDGSLGSTASSLASTSVSLADTSTTLRNVSGTLVVISGSLGDTSSSLTDTANSLTGTSSSLRNTSSSLRGTSGVLVNVGGTVRDINSRLRVAQTTASRGTELIPINVARVNRVLRPVEADTTAIDSGLVSVNNHLTSVCQSNVLKVPIPGFVTPRAEC